MSPPQVPSRPSASPDKTPQVLNWLMDHASQPENPMRVERLESLADGNMRCYVSAPLNPLTHAPSVASLQNHYGSCAAELLTLLHAQAEFTPLPADHLLFTIDAGGYAGEITTVGFSEKIAAHIRFGGKDSPEGRFCIDFNPHGLQWIKGQPPYRRAQEAVLRRESVFSAVRRGPKRWLRLAREHLFTAAGVWKDDLKEDPLASLLASSQVIRALLYRRGMPASLVEINEFYISNAGDGSDDRYILPVRFGDALREPPEGRRERYTDTISRMLAALHIPHHSPPVLGDPAFMAKDDFVPLGYDPGTIAAMRYRHPGSFRDLHIAFTRQGLTWLTAQPFYQETKESCAHSMRAAQAKYSALMGAALPSGEDPREAVHFIRDQLGLAGLREADLGNGAFLNLKKAEEDENKNRILSTLEKIKTALDKAPGSGTKSR